jgi:membrane protease subunit HflC
MSDRLISIIKASVAIVFLLIFGLIGFACCSYSVKPNEYAIPKFGGSIKEIQEEPGLHFNNPLYDVQKISKAVQLYDIPKSDVITKDKKTMIADTYVLWRVTNVKEYTQSLNATEANAISRIEANVYNSTKNIISGMTQEEIIAARGDALTQKITADANEDMTGYGIEIITAEIKALDLPDDNKEAVYQRMISERSKIAAAYKAEGDAEAQKIKNEADKQVQVLKAEAQATASQLEGEGEAEYMKILASAYNTPEKAEFYNYIRAIEAMQESLKGSNEKTLILDKSSELAQILYGNIR